jgi:ABC-type microcin C transport system duplicated ATPase subunit YejF
MDQRLGQSAPIREVGLAVMGLLPRGARANAARIMFGDTDLRRLSERRLAQLRGNRMAMVFQEPMTSLNPAYTVGSQMTEVLRRHRGIGHGEAAIRAAAMLERVGVSAPEMRLGNSPTNSPADCANEY